MCCNRSGEHVQCETRSVIETLARHVPGPVLARSGKVFYAGRDAFVGRSDLYVLGVNPGGSAEEAPSETVENHTRDVLTLLPSNWSAYRDEVWRGRLPGTYGMAPRILHLFQRLGADPGHVPASNLVFVRSRRESNLADEMLPLAHLCWPFHEAVIQAVKPKVVLCLGGTAGKYVRSRLGANTLHSQFVEQNRRRWTSQVFVNRAGVRVVIATHPSIADWTTLSTDPTPLIQSALQ